MPLLVLALLLVASVSVSAGPQPESLLPNGGFEAGDADAPEGWSFAWERTHSNDPKDVTKQKPDFAWDDGERHSGKRSVRIGVARPQDDGVWSSQTFAARPGTRIYLARAWIKTRDVKETQAHIALVASAADGKWLGAGQTEREVRELLARINFSGAKGAAAQGDGSGRKEILPTGERAVSGDFKMAVGWIFADYDAARRLVADWIVRLDRAK